MQHRPLIFALLLSEAMASLIERDDCSDGFTLCAPSGATSAATPRIGDPSFPSLFDDILSSNLPSSTGAKQVASTLQTTAATSSLCCNALISCLLMTNLLLPFCYDPFTTNYHLPDGAYGTVAFGTYISASDDTCNLESGEYTLANGTTGNIYTDDPAASPDLATLILPTQYTASGVGSAVPASSLGIEITTTYTTTLPGTTLPGSTIPPVTLPPFTSTEMVLLAFTTTTTVSGASLMTVLPSTTFTLQVEEGSTLPGSTIPGTTISPIVTVVTTTEAKVAGVTESGNATAAAATTGKKSGAERGRAAAEGWIVAIVLGTNWVLGCFA